MQLSDWCCRVPQVGLDAAGKTTILYKLKLGEIVTTIPTIGEWCSWAVSGVFANAPPITAGWILTVAPRRRVAGHLAAHSAGVRRRRPCGQQQVAGSCLRRKHSLFAQLVEYMWRLLNAMSAARRDMAPMKIDSFAVAKITHKFCVHCRSVMLLWVARMYGVPGETAVQMWGLVGSHRGG